MRSRSDPRQFVEAPVSFELFVGMGEHGGAIASPRSDASAAASVLPNDASMSVGTPIATGSGLYA